MIKNILVFGSTGAIGGAIISHYAKQFPHANIHAVSHSVEQPSSDNLTTHQLDFNSDKAMKSLAKTSKPS